MTNRTRDRWTTLRAAVLMLVGACLAQGIGCSKGSDRAPGDGSENTIRIRMLAQLDKSYDYVIATQTAPKDILDDFEVAFERIELIATDDSTHLLWEKSDSGARQEIARGHVFDNVQSLQPGNSYKALNLVMDPTVTFQGAVVEDGVIQEGGGESTLPVSELRIDFPKAEQARSSMFLSIDFVAPCEATFEGDARLELPCPIQTKLRLVEMDLTFAKLGIYDDHVHTRWSNAAEILEKSFAFVGIERAAFISTERTIFGTLARSFLTYNPQTLYTKLVFEGKSRAMAALNLDKALRGDSGLSEDFVQQVTDYWKMGFDGLKFHFDQGQYELLYEASTFEFMPSEPVFDEMWRKIGEVKAPVLIHLEGRPKIESPTLTIPGTTGLQEFTAFMENIKSGKYGPSTNFKILLAHFNPPADADDGMAQLRLMFDTYPFLYSEAGGFVNYLNGGFTADREEAIQFFEDYQDRILTGTDVGPCNEDGTGTTAAAPWKCPNSIDYRFEAMANIRRYLETDQEVTFPIHFNTSAKRVVKGLALPPSVLQRIYQDNFVELFSTPEPRPIHCSEITAMQDHIASRLIPGIPSSNGDLIGSRELEFISANSAVLLGCP